MPNLLHQQSESVTVSLRLPARMEVELKELSDKQSISMNSTIIRILAKALQEIRHESNRT